ncbi:redoxin family protein [Tellurirhabdus rosea]|uniref:redoxin family protein n=1 Tax=Tellurirhabdus rosea TaxID=2674997 RepID=UPI002257AE63|nr:TlpA disulfide reductase family protein [Tellurirhabdus rosea]
MKSFICLFLFLWITTPVVAQQQKVPYLITGQVTHAEGKKVFLTSKRSAFARQGRQQAIDSTVVQNGAFTLKGAIPEPHYYAILVEDKPYFKAFPLDSVPLRIRANADSLAQALVTGSPNATHERVLAYILREYDAKLNASYRRAQEARKNGDTLAHWRASLENRGLAWQINEETADFIRTYPESLVSLFNLAALIDKLPRPEVLELWKALAPHWQQHSVGKALREELFFPKPLHAGRSSATPVGQAAPDLSLVNSKGEPVDLASFRGKVVLITYWASGCESCRAEHTRLKTLYGQYVGKGFEIVSVSLDRNRKAWLATLRREALPWQQVMRKDLPRQPVEGPPLGQAVPINMLLDREGRIVRKGVHGSALETSLASLLALD